MRILHLNPFYFPYAGGIERRIRALGRRHAARHEVHLLTAQPPGAEPEDEDRGIRIHRAPSSFHLGRFYNPPYVRSNGLSEKIQEIQPDVIDLHSRWSPSYARAYRRAHAARVFTYHNTFGEGSGALGLLSRLNDAATRRFVARSDLVLGVSRFMLDDLARHGFPHDRLRLSPNGVDAAALQKQADPAVAPDADLLVAAGRLVGLKGYDVLLRALRHLPPPVHALICGEGPARPALAALARRLGVAARVDLPGWVPEPEKLARLRGCLAFVHPARFEAFGLAPLEAMAMGSPVVATRVGGLPELVGDAGVLVRPDDPRALAQAIRELRDDPRRHRALANAGRARAAAYSWDEAAARLEEHYHEAVHTAKI